ncbi:unnamed protein product [Paramecium primaurelia]|uniref:DC1 domain-containing protein n=1 Tax=Paramecium primaurelia TaxID=5886 RepID=A0A8S1L4D8_PARPR|nr:unnamed protein product [Paramecium primaurelia]
MNQFILPYCPKYHQLQWKSKKIQSCLICLKEKKLSQYYCTECKQGVCNECIKPPLDGFYCGGNHKMQFMSNLPHHSCDLCEKSISQAYSCRTCDFDICENCRQFDE